MNLNNLERLPDSEVQCTRCETHMKQTGTLELHEGSRAVNFVLGPLAVNHLELEAYICPKCGKVEFFV